MTHQAMTQALERIRDKLIRMGAKLPISVEGTIESAINTGHSHALLLVEDELAALQSAVAEGASPSLDAPASPSGSSLQPPAAASAAIPGARGAKFDHILGVSCAAAYQAEQREHARIERVVGAIEAAKSSEYSEADNAFHAYWYGHMVNDQIQPPLDRISYSVARYVWDAARGMEARGMEARSGETPQAARPEGRQPGAEGTRPEAVSVSPPQAAVSAEGWISVDVRLPPNDPGDPAVVMYSDDLRNPADMLIGILRDKRWMAAGYEMRNVTHWMPLPPPPTLPQPDSKGVDRG